MNHAMVYFPKIIVTDFFDRQTQNRTAKEKIKEGEYQELLMVKVQ